MNEGKENNPVNRRNDKVIDHNITTIDSRQLTLEDKYNQLKDKYNLLKHEHELAKETLILQSKEIEVLTEEIHQLTYFGNKKGQVVDNRNASTTNNDHEDDQTKSPQEEYKCAGCRSRESRISTLAATLNSNKAKRRHSGPELALDSDDDSDDMKLLQEKYDCAGNSDTKVYREKRRPSGPEIALDSDDDSDDMKLIQEKYDCAGNSDTKVYREKLRHSGPEHALDSDDDSDNMKLIQEKYDCAGQARTNMDDGLSNRQELRHSGRTTTSEIDSASCEEEKTEEQAPDLSSSVYPGAVSHSGRTTTSEIDSASCEEEKTEEQAPDLSSSVHPGAVAVRGIDEISSFTRNRFLSIFRTRNGGMNSYRRATVRAPELEAVAVDEEEQKERLKTEIQNEMKEKTISATKVERVESPQQKRRKKLLNIFVICLSTVAIIVIVVLSIKLTEKNDNEVFTPAPTMNPDPKLQQIKEAGTLRCFVIYPQQDVPFVSLFDMLD